MVPTQTMAPTGYNVTIPDRIPSATYDSPITTEDVFLKRGQYEQQQNLLQQFDTNYNSLVNKIGQPTSSLFADPESFINNLLLNRPTDTQNQLDQTRSDQSQNFQDFGNELNRDTDRARKDYGVSGLQSTLAETRNQIAERTKRLREDLRNFEVNANERGVAREFVKANKQKLQADAAAELADLAIIESAQLGNLQQAQQEVEAVIQEKMRAFELENASIEAEIQRLEAMDSREADQRKEQLQIALGERTRLFEKKLADDKSIREYMVEAAANGADQATLNAIRNAGGPGEAALLAGPWLGRLDRQLTNAQIANIYSQIGKRTTGDGPSSADANKVANELARAETILANTTEALGAVGITTTGLGSLSKYIPGTPARDLSATIDTIKANLGFEQLQRMRDASPTGGALGQVAIQELIYLQAAVSNLDQGQSRDALTKNLQDVDIHYTNWVKAVGASMGKQLEVEEGVVYEITN